jgi:hypothetical protein
MMGRQREVVLFALAACFSVAGNAQVPQSVVPSTRPDSARRLNAAAARDTTSPVITASARFINTGLYGALCASYAASENWGGQNLKNYAFAGNVLYRHNVFEGTRSHAHLFMADLGYLKFVDSIWVKNMDRIQTNFLWSSTGKRLNQSYMIAFGTQFLPNKIPMYDPETGTVTDASVGGFLNPFTLEAGYGAVFTFWNTSNINFAFATLKLNSTIRREQHDRRPERLLLPELWLLHSCGHQQAVRPARAVDQQYAGVRQRGGPRPCEPGLQQHGDRKAVEVSPVANGYTARLQPHAQLQDAVQARGTCGFLL